MKTFHCGESDGMEIRITNEEYYKHDPENNNTTLKSLIEMSQTTLNDLILKNH